MLEVHDLAKDKNFHLPRRLAFATLWHVGSESFNGSSCCACRMEKYQVVTPV